MYFDLTNELIGDILFSMEDQDNRFRLDVRRGVVVPQGEPFDEGAEEDGEGRYQSLPEWDSADGYRLMEHFAAGLRNPLIREELGQALTRGRGVFRAFKDILGQYPETEKLWFTFKEREMRKEIFRWYNALREEWGMSLIGGEPEETGDLVLEDFRIRESTDADFSAAAELHRACREEQEMLPDNFPWSFPGDFCLVAETVHGDFAGYTAASRQTCHNRICIHALELRPEYRGLGLGEALLQRLLDIIPSPALVSIELPAGAEGFFRVLRRLSFEQELVRYSLSK